MDAVQEAAERLRKAAKRVDRATNCPFIYEDDDKVDKYSPYKAAQYISEQYHVVVDNKQIWVYRDGKYETQTENWIGSQITAIAEDLYNINAHRSTIHFITMLCHGEMCLVHTPHLFGCSNGVLNLKTGELMPHSHEHKLKYLSPAVYNPTIKNDVIVSIVKEITPEWDEFMNVCAALLIDKQFKHWVFIVGPGGTGLSTLVQIITNLVGTEAICGTDVELLKKNQFAARDLMNARVLLNTEHEGNKLESEFMKRLTGGDPLRGEDKFGASYLFHPACTPITTTNDPADPYSAGQDMGRRVITITCPYYFVEEPEGDNQKLIDPTTRAKVDDPENVTAFINTLMSRALDILNEGEVPMIRGKDVEKLEMLSHSADSFVDSCCVLFDNPELTHRTYEYEVDNNALDLNTSNIYVAYVKFCDGRTRCLSKKAFWSRVNAHVKEIGGKVVPAKNNQCRFMGVIKEPGIKSHDDRHLSNEAAAGG